VIVLQCSIQLRSAGKVIRKSLCYNVALIGLPLTEYIEVSGLDDDDYFGRKRMWENLATLNRRFVK